MIDISKLTDKEITCVDCSSTFTFTAGEASYFLSKGMPEPKRCLACRQRRKNALIIDSRVVRYDR
jgi:hypothetical protein